MCIRDRYVITQGLGTKFTPMAVAYCVFGVVAAFGVGNATQINAVISGINDVVTRFGGEQTRLGNLVMGLILAALVGAMLLGLSLIHICPEKGAIKSKPCIFRR